MWGLIFLGSLWLAAGCGQVAGPGACRLYNLSVPEGSSGHVEINIPKNIPVSTLYKMQTTIAAAASDSACHSILLLTNQGKRNYYNSTYRGRISLSDRLLFTVKNASEWMAGEYQVITDLSKTCTARINLTVPGPVSFPPPISETPAASPTGEGSSRGMLSNGSPEGEPRSHYGVWISLGFITALFTATALYVCWKHGREGPGTRHGCEEEGISDSADTCLHAGLCLTLARGWNLRWRGW
ncbi:uncharacterized protein LOC123344966 [Mauremys mutica]|uniref:Uncharacterized protein n=1 Tax=Mauremys mutica TaxID=74926 RepID=A0A9D3XM08_9SAUR|nr:uncharacterized protein LOC123344966 [Mauremys mutica]XP_044837405.1 uncharacterized protein LOC123344966 [Mauremys mutica]KAH1183079.1 hypothetical protein KIL84_004571 [Mauremys mutica]